MTAVAKILSPVAGLLGVFDKPKVQTVSPLPTATPRENSAVADALARRRGSAANIRTGDAGAESTTTAKKTLMGT